jgi:small basic protein (TIGR04137 family)
MSLDRSLKSANALIRHRNVLTRDERLLPAEGSREVGREEERLRPAEGGKS